MILQRDGTAAHGQKLRTWPNAPARITGYAVLSLGLIFAYERLNNRSMKCVLNEFRILPTSNYNLSVLMPSQRNRLILGVIPFLFRQRFSRLPYHFVLILSFE